jgi:hypothetical protein
MRKICLILFAIFLNIVSFSQAQLHSGKNDGTTLLFDSGGVSLGVKEYNFDSCGITERQIYKCEFTLKTIIHIL